MRELLVRSAERLLGFVIFLAFTVLWAPTLLAFGVGIIFLATFAAGLEDAAASSAANTLAANLTDFTNVASVALLSLSAIAYTRSPLASQADRAKWVFAGDRFLHGGLLSVLASVLLYGARYLREFLEPDRVPDAVRVVLEEAGPASFMAFVIALVAASVGVVTLNGLFVNAILPPNVLKRMFPRRP